VVAKCQLSPTIFRMESRNQEEIAQLPIPGGWKWETVTLSAHTWRLLLPADPDAFILEGPAQEEWPDPYWAQLWPAAKTIAALVLAQHWPAETNILELGCGNGFVGLAAAARGWRVTFSDYVPFAVELSLANARGNRCLNISGEVADWRDPPSDHAFERIIACECLYDPELHVPLLQTMRARLKPGGLVWLCDPGRGELAPQFARIAREQGWRVSLFDQHLLPQENFVWQQFRLIQLE
jgi:predicted nicotinamide N-methyase